jgi:hypothetical protein
MSTFKERLIAEKQDLDDKLIKLVEFINSEKFATVAPIQMTLLNIQSQAMATYSQCLLERIAWLEK